MCKANSFQTSFVLDTSSILSIKVKIVISAQYLKNLTAASL